MSKIKTFFVLKTTIFNLWAFLNKVISIGNLQDIITKNPWQL